MVETSKRDNGVTSEIEDEVVVNQEDTHQCTWICILETTGHLNIVTMISIQDTSNKGDQCTMMISMLDKEEAQKTDKEEVQACIQTNDTTDHRCMTGMAEQT